MKGVILAGGLGSRLAPLTRVTNKHLLPVYDKPMIYYPLGTLIQAGITEIMIVTGGKSAGDFIHLLRNGEDFGLSQLHYAYQDREGGIADALRKAESFADGSPICVILGDNILEKSIEPFVRKFRHQGQGAKILLHKVENPSAYGVPEFYENGRIGSIEEKPKEPQSDFAVIGVYMYDSRVFDVIKSLKPSARGELEISDVNNAYIAKGDLTWDELPGWWGDAGSFDGLMEASILCMKDAKENECLKSEKSV